MILRYKIYMKRIALFVPLFICISQMAIADDQSIAATRVNTAQSQPVNTIRINTRPEILGLWGMEIPNNRKCTEYYNFRGGNEVIVNSAKEWSAGLYDYQPSPDNTLEKLPTLVMQIKYENNQVDCSGQQEDQSGEVSQYYVKWKNNNTINFCSAEQPNQCFATLHRVLP